MHRLARRSTAFALLALAAVLTAPQCAAAPPATRVGPALDATAAATPASSSSIAAQRRLDRQIRLALDSAQPLAARQTALTAVKQAAQGGNGEAQFVVGSLYMWGPQHPAALLPRDLDKAQTYLSNAAVHGWFEAMAAMAEVSLIEKQPEAAQVWALVDYYFSGADHYAAKGYLADLIHRSERSLTAGQRQQALVAANAFIARYRAGIRTAQAKDPGRSLPDCDLHYLYPRRRRHLASIGPDSDVPRSGDAMFLVGVDRAGKVARVIPINSFPSWRVFRITRQMARDTRFNPAPACSTALRWGAMPFDYGSGEYEFNR